MLDALAITVAKNDSRDAQLNILEKKAKQDQKAEDFLLLGKIFRYRGDPDSALSEYQHAALLDNKNFDVLKEYGTYQQQVGQTQQAVSTLSQAYRINDQDTEVIASLRQLGVVPGPSLKEKAELAQPVIPKGPIPPLDLSKIGLGGSGDKPQPASPAAAIQAPRD